MSTCNKLERLTVAFFSNLEPHTHKQTLDFARDAC
jgi:hypothetical protein